MVAEVATPLDPETHLDTDATGPFNLGPADRLLDRVDEHASLDLATESDENLDQHTTSR